MLTLATNNTPTGQQPIIVRTPPAGDPTRTIGLRDRFAADATSRLKQLRRDLVTSIVDNDAFGIGEQSQAPAALEAAAPGEWAFTWDVQKVEAFQNWLEEEEARGILEVTRGPGVVGIEPWSNVYIRDSYQKGLDQGAAHMRGAGIIPAGEGLEIVSAFHQPVSINRVGLLYTRTFDGLKGITAQMNAQMSRILADGLAAGESPSAIARKLTNRIDKIGITRSRMLARTEIVNAHNNGALVEYERAGQIIGETVDVQWYATLDERVRSTHAARHEKIFTKAEATLLIGEPNCLLGDSVAFSPSNLERVFKRGYKGQIIHIETAEGNKLSCSPNHPILTMTGFVPAKDLGLGSNILCCSMADVANSVGANENDVISSMEDKADSLSLSGEISRGSTVPLNFHGDGTDGEVAIIFTDRGLKNNTIDPQSLKTVCKKLLSWVYLGAKRYAFSPANKIVGGAFHTSDGIMRRLGSALSFSVVHSRPLDALCFASASGPDPVAQENLVHRGPAVPAPKSLGERFCDGIDRVPGIERYADSIFASKIRRITTTNDFDGHLYNLQTKGGSYIAQNIIVGNCRCSLLPWLEEFAEDKQDAA